jgi:hypothetical protein
MRYHLPPREDPVPRTIGGVARIHASPRLDAHPEQDLGSSAEGRLIRTVELGAAAAHEHLRLWEAEAAAHDIPAPPGVVARERSRPDRVHAGALRRQRLAIAWHGEEATAAHWSVPEPPTPADQRAWERVLARIATGRDSRGGWTA